MKVLIEWLRFRVHDNVYTFLLFLARRCGMLHVFPASFRRRDILCAFLLVLEVRSGLYL